DNCGGDASAGGGVMRGSGEKGGQRRRCSGVHIRVAVVAGVVLWRRRGSGVTGGGAACEGKWRRGS
nr:hypothetical protein [Tanacetum cinerariifolium]